MATVVGYTPWIGHGKEWPVGTKEGDLAILCVWSGRYRFRRMDAGWSSAGRFTYYAGGDARWAVWVGHAYYTTVTAAMLAKDPPSEYGQLVVLAGAPGIGTVRTNTRGAPALANGGVLSFSWTTDQSLSDRDPSVTWFTPPGSETQPSIWGTMRAYAVVGWETATSDGVYGDGSRRGSLSIEVLPPVAPSMPVLLSPTAGAEASTTEDIIFEWQHRPSISGGYQDAYRLRADGGAGWQWWNASTDGFVASEFTNVSSVSREVIDPSKFVANVPYSWQVSTREGLDGQWSPYSPANELMTVVPPTATITSPVGTVNNDLTPTVTGTATTPRGSLTARRVQVVDPLSLQVLFDSGSQPGEEIDYELPRLDWERNKTYDVGLMVQQTGGSWSSWARELFTITWDLPTPPTIAVAPSAFGIAIEIGSTLPVRMERISPEGLWEEILPLTYPVDGKVYLNDVFAPTYASTAYRVRSVNELEGQTLSSEWMNSDPVVSTDPDAYIASAVDPLRTWIPLDLHMEVQERVHQEPVSTHYGLDDPYGRVVYGNPQGQTGNILMHTRTKQDTNLAMALLRTQEPLVVKFVPQRAREECSWGIGELRTISRSSMITERELHSTLQDRELSFEWIEHPQVLLGNPSDAPRTCDFYVEAYRGIITITGPSL